MGHKFLFVYFRVINTGLLPRILNQKLSHVEYAKGASFDSAAVGSYLITIEQPTGSYKFLGAYIDMLCAFHEVRFLSVLEKSIYQPIKIKIRLDSLAIKFYTRIQYELN